MRALSFDGVGWKPVSGGCIVVAMLGTVHMTSDETSLILEAVQNLNSSLDLRVAFDRAIPSLQRLFRVEHVALAVSRSASFRDYDWMTWGLPDRFLRDYPAIGDRDFVRAAVVRMPNRVMRDHEMIERKALERHVIYQHARDCGVSLEQVMAVMLVHNREWSSGLSLYRDRSEAFTDREASLFAAIVPHIVNAVQNSRSAELLDRSTRIEPTLGAAGVGIVWVDAGLREVDRTHVATAILDEHFSCSALRAGKLPQELLAPLRSRALGSKTPPIPELQIERGLRRLHVHYIALPELALWALVMRVSGLPRTLESSLTPRLLQVARLVLKGMSNEEIARQDKRALCTIKQQVSEIYARLGVEDRAAFIRLAAGWGDIPETVSERSRGRSSR
jgi:DNA-binding NarL/FixJ family response regulator